MYNQSYKRTVPNGILSECIMRHKSRIQMIRIKKQTYPGDSRHTQDNSEAEDDVGSGQHDDDVALCLKNFTLL